jgi:hypothetical protein
VYGVASKSSKDSGGVTILCPPVTGSPFDCIYGVHFSAKANENNKAVIFVDENRNYVYDAITDSVAETITWNAPIFISEVRCVKGATGCYDKQMDVTFRRPNPDGFIADVTPCTGQAVFPATVCPGPGGAPVNSENSYNSGEVVLHDGGTLFSTTTITLTGQISLQ